MSKRLIQSDSTLKPAGAYSPGLRAGDFIFTAGQTPINPKTGELAGDTIEAQTAQVLENIQAILQAGGASMAGVVKVTVHLSDLSLFSRFNEVYTCYFPEPKPVRTTVGSQLIGILVEIDALAYVGKE